MSLLTGADAKTKAPGALTTGSFLFSSHHFEEDDQGDR
jgi:hypothetical protein